MQLTLITLHDEYFVNILVICSRFEFQGKLKAMKAMVALGPSPERLI